MKYLVPPIVIPVLLVIGIAAYALLRPPIIAGPPPVPVAASQPREGGIGCAAAATLSPFRKDQYEGTQIPRWPGSGIFPRPWRRPDGQRPLQNCPSLSWGGQ